jgi:hypothetical protein
MSAQLKGTPAPEGLKHGRQSWARRAYHCGCGECLPSGKRRPAKGQGATQAEKSKRLRDSKRGQPVPDTVKHGRYAYKVYACRCPICRAAKANAEKRWSLRVARPDVARYDERGEITVIHWPPVGEGMWECPECHEKVSHRSTL